MLLPRPHKREMIVLQLIRNTPKPSASSSLVPNYINAQEPCFLIQPPEQEGRCQDDAQRSVY